MKAALRRAAGWAWLVLWIGTLRLASDPWRRLGGIVDERLRWLEWVALVIGIPIGFTAGRYALERAEARDVSTYVHAARRVWFPLAVSTAAVMSALYVAGACDPIGVVLTAFLSYWAGADVAMGVLPLISPAPSESPRRSRARPPRPAERSAGRLDL